MPRTRSRVIIMSIVCAIASLLILIQLAVRGKFGQKKDRFLARKIQINRPAKEEITSHLSTIFSDDYIPDIYSATVTEGTIHFCIVAAKAEIASEVRFLVRSIILHARRNDVFFHFIVFKGSEKTIPPVIEEVRKAFVNIKYELTEVNLTKYLNDKLQNNVRMTHVWSGIYGVGKIFLYDLLPHVEKCIVADTDIVFGADPAFLWSETVTILRPPVAVATTLIPKLNTISSGVMIQHFQYMREIKFEKLITMKKCGIKTLNGNKTFLCYGDQALLNGIKNEHKELFAHFTESWNLSRCTKYKNYTFDSFQDKKSGLFFGVAHMSCFPPKMKNVFQEGKKRLPKNLQDYIDFLDEMNLEQSGKHAIVRV